MYKQIKVKEDVLDKLKVAVALVNDIDGDKCNKLTVAGLVTRLADACSKQVSGDILASNDIGWLLNGYPIMVNSDAAKHYNEFRLYCPDTFMLEINQMIRNRAMDERFKRLKVGV